MRTSPSYTASYRIEVDEKTTSIASIVDAVSSTGAEIKGLDVADSDRGRIIIDLTRCLAWPPTRSPTRPS